MAYLSKNVKSQGNNKRVLIIDDEEMILMLMCEDLTSRGYEVKATSNGETALQAFQETDFDLTVCDWKIPGLNGRQIYERMREINPRACERMIFMSGDVVNPQIQRFLKEENCAYLSKPFSLSEFHTAVEKVLKT